MPVVVPLTLCRRYSSRPCAHFVEAPTPPSCRAPYWCAAKQQPSSIVRYVRLLAVGRCAGGDGATPHHGEHSSRKDKPQKRTGTHRKTTGATGGAPTQTATPKSSPRASKEPSSTVPSSHPPTHTHPQTSPPTHPPTATRPKLPQRARHAHAQNERGLGRDVRSTHSKSVKLRKPRKLDKKTRLFHLWSATRKKDKERCPTGQEGSE